MLGSQFLSTPSARRATRYFSAATSSRHSFLSTPSARRATQFFDHRDFIQHDFYPRPPRGGRPQMSPACPSISYFYPRPPRGGRPATTSLTSTHKGISIHALREEGDAFQKLLLVFDCLFLSTPSARRATSSTKGSYTTPVTFLSTPSARRATPTAARPIRHPPYFYPRPPRGGRRLLGGAAVVNDGISIHALREEGDAGRCRNTYLPGYFYPRPPRGGRQMVIYPITQLSNFYPRPPRGGRRPITLFQ